MRGLTDENHDLQTRLGEESGVQQSCQQSNETLQKWTVLVESFGVDKAETMSMVRCHQPSAWDQTVFFNFLDVHHKSQESDERQYDTGPEMGDLFLR